MPQLRQLYHRLLVARAWVQSQSRQDLLSCLFYLEFATEVLYTDLSVPHDHLNNLWGE